MINFDFVKLYTSSFSIIAKLQLQAKQIITVQLLFNNICTSRYLVITLAKSFFSLILRERGTYRNSGICQSLGIFSLCWQCLDLRNLQLFFFDFLIFSHLHIFSIILHGFPGRSVQCSWFPSCSGIACVSSVCFCCFV